MGSQRVRYGWAHELYVLNILINITSNGNDEVKKMMDYFFLNVLGCIISNHQVMSLPVVSLEFM